MDEQVLYMVPVVVFGIVAILFAGWLARDVMARDQGTPEMQKVSSAIFMGAKAYLNRQYRTIGQLAVVVAIIMGILVAIFENDHQVSRGIITSLAFLIGASLSGISGYIGMYVAVRSNIRTAAAARKGMGEALVVALRGGAVSGFLVVALGLLGISGVFCSSQFSPKDRAPPSRRRRSGSLALRLGPVSSPSSRNSAAVFTPKRLTLAQILSAKSRPVFRRTIRETPRLSLISSATTWAIARAAAPTSSSHPPQR